MFSPDPEKPNEVDDLFGDVAQQRASTSAAGPASPKRAVPAGPASNPFDEARGTPELKNSAGPSFAAAEDKDDGAMKIAVDDPKTEGGRLQSYVTYCVSVKPPLPGVSSVRRRYSDFEWLRKTLLTLFPGVFIPPLPEKKIFASKDEDFVKERAVGLERFMNRLAALSFVSGSDAFHVFLSRHEASFEMAKKDVEKVAKTQSNAMLAKYSELFPEAFRESRDISEELVHRLKTFLEKSETELGHIVKHCDALITCTEEAAESGAHIVTSLGQLCRIENDYSARPEPSRPNVIGTFERWHLTLKQASNTFRAHLYDTFRNEQEDFQAMLEVLRNREAMRSTYEKLKAKCDKWRLPTTVVGPKEVPKKEEDLAQEEIARSTLEVVTKTMLYHEVQQMWAQKIQSFKLAMAALAADYLETAKMITATWDTVTSKVEL